VKRTPIIIGCGAFLLSLAADTVISEGNGHANVWWSHIYGFFPLFGLVGCLAIIYIAKFLGAHWLQRKENYYESRNSYE